MKLIEYPDFWSLEHEGKSIEFDEDNFNILIAAPELLEACKSIINNIDNGTYWKVDIADIEKVKKAIQKAGGK